MNTSGTVPELSGMSYRETREVVDVLTLKISRIRRDMIPSYKSQASHDYVYHRIVL